MHVYKGEVRITLWFLRSLGAYTYVRTAFTIARCGMVLEVARRIFRAADKMYRYNNVSGMYNVVCKCTGEGGREMRIKGADFRKNEVERAVAALCLLRERAEGTQCAACAERK